MSVLNQFRLDGKTALVTGCRRGIGKAMAVALAEAGADVVGVSLSLKKSESEVQKEVERNGKRFYGYQCDFSEREQLMCFIQRVKRDISRIDIVVSNAGMVLRQAASEHPDEYWSKVMEVNLNSQFVLVREMSKPMLERGSGKIIFTASLLSFQGGITVPGYAASKGGIRTLTMALSNEWASKGVNVNSIAPGYIRTDNTAPLQEDAIRNEAIISRIPAGRWGEPEDLKGATVFLASSAADYVNGVTLVVDGGWIGR